MGINLQTSKFLKFQVLVLLCFLLDQIYSLLNLHFNYFTVVIG